MNVKFAHTNATIRLWLLAFQTGDLLKMCMEKLFSEYDITPEQYDVLVSIKYLGDRINVTDIASWLRRSTNSVSMLVDRMVKAGLVKRTRDKVDRRVVYVIITSKGKTSLNWQIRHAGKLSRKFYRHYHMRIGKPLSVCSR